MTTGYELDNFRQRKRSADYMERIAKALERIADALEGYDPEEDDEEFP